MKKFLLIGVLTSLFLQWGCTASDSDRTTWGTGDPETDTGFDSNDTGDPTVSGDFEPDCNACPSVGDSLDHLRCAVDLCDNEVFLGQEFTSPSGASTNDVYAAVERFGDPNNHLAPLHGSSYGLMATGTAKGNAHNVSQGGGSSTDPLDPAADIFDVMEWRVHLKAPEGAHGIKIHYVFFSTEYDEYVGSEYNDKFYIFVDGNSQYTSYNMPINITNCRGAKKDGMCSQELADIGICQLGDSYCYIAINSALSECCWKDGCPNGVWSTDIGGTGFICADDRTQEMQNIAGMWSPKAGSDKFGSSTGWLATEWPVEPGEEFDIVFHIHDTADSSLDSEVILDKVLFVGDVAPGTKPI